MATFLEGVEVIVQACTLVIAIPTLALIAASRGRAAMVLAAAVPTTALVMWAKAAGYWTVDNRGWMVLPIAAGIIATFAAAHLSVSRPGWQLPIGAGLLGGALAGWNWRPCVGTELGGILSDAGTDQARTLALMVIYTAGALLPIIVIAALPAALPNVATAMQHRYVAGAGLLVGLFYAGTVAVGRYDDLVGELYRISSA